MDDFDNENCMDDDKTIRQQVSTFWEANSESDSDSEVRCCLNRSCPKL